MERNFATFERRVLRQILELKKNQNDGAYDKRKNQDLRKMLMEEDFVVVFKIQNEKLGKTHDLQALKHVIRVLNI